MDYTTIFPFLPEGLGPAAAGNWPKDVYGDSVGAQMRYNTAVAQLPPSFKFDPAQAEAFSRWLAAQPLSKNVVDVVGPEQEIQPGERNLLVEGYHNITPTLEQQGLLPNELALALGYHGIGVGMHPRGVPLPRARPQR